MADSTIANSLAETSVTAGNDDDPDDVLRGNLQHLLCQAEENGQTIKMYQDECDKLDDKCIAMETICDKLADKCIASRRRHKRKVDELEDARRRHHSDKEKIQELQDRLDVKRAEKLRKMKSQAEPPRPSLSAKKPVIKGDQEAKNFHLEVRDGERTNRLRREQ